MEDLLRRTLVPAIVLEMVLAGGLWHALSDPNQLESAVLNLAINARRHDGGHTADRGTCRKSAYAGHTAICVRF